MNSTKRNRFVGALASLPAALVMGACVTVTVLPSPAPSPPAEVNPSPSLPVTPLPSPTPQATPATPTGSPTLVPSPTQETTPTALPTVSADANQLDHFSWPQFGTLDIAAGFRPDPRTIDLVAGGAVDVAYLGGNCYGFAAPLRHVSVIYDPGGDSLLRLYFVSPGDTVLIVNDAQSNWVCGDDSYGTLNPSIDFIDPASGRYDIWVGSLRTGETWAGTLYVTGRDRNHP